MAPDDLRRLYHWRRCCFLVLRYLNLLRELRLKAAANMSGSRLSFVFDVKLLRVVYGRLRHLHRVRSVLSTSSMFLGFDDGSMSNMRRGERSDWQPGWIGFSIEGLVIQFATSLPVKHYCTSIFKHSKMQIQMIHQGYESGSYD